MTNISEDKVVTILGLLIKCPLDEPADDCPATKYRDLPFDEKFRLARNMKKEDADKIISHHKECIRLREMELFGYS